jgi:hypothetical protein
VHSYGIKSVSGVASIYIFSLMARCQYYPPFARSGYVDVYLFRYPSREWVTTYPGILNSQGMLEVQCVPFAAIRARAHVVDETG